MPLRLLPFFLIVLLSGCSSPSYTYRYVPGKTATISGGYAVAPRSAPRSVQAAIAAGNQIVGLPYRYGGGHGRGIDSAYDCSGAVSFVLREAGLLADSMPSRGFRNYGQSGEGRWISVYARKDHVFLVIAGLRFDTGYTRGPKGPQWTTRDRPAPGSVVRHPRGL
ncbi:MAG: peptidoglycan endopeptidase [Chthoniobacteraceae bacterium]